MRTLLGGLLLLIMLNCARALAPEVTLQLQLDDRSRIASVIIDDPVAPAQQVNLAGTWTQGVIQFYLAALDEAGAVVNADSWGNGDRLNQMIRAGDSSGVMIGRSLVGGDYNYKLMHANFAGTLQGNEAFGAFGIDEIGEAISELAPDTFLVAGRSGDLDLDSTALTLVKVTIDGDVLDSWAYPIGEVGIAVDAPDDTTVWVYGTTRATQPNDANFLMVRTRADDLGEEVFARSFGGPEADYCRAAVRVDANLTLLVGETYSFSAEPSRADIWIVATNDAGDSLWSRTYGDTLDDAAFAVLPVDDNDNGCLLGGYLSEMLISIDSLHIDSLDTTIAIFDTAIVTQGLLLKLNANGDSVWAIVMQDSVDTEFADVALDASYKYYAAGLRRPNAEYGYYLVTDPDPAAPVQHPPNPFNLLAPADGDTLGAGNIQFNWELATDPDPGDQIRYALLLDADTLFDNPIAIGPLLNPTYTWTSDTDDVELYWRVAAQDNADNIRVCNQRQWSFKRVIPDPTQPFSLAAPDSGSAIPTPSAQFRWEPALDPDLTEQLTYDLVIEVGDTSFTVEGLTDTSVTLDLSTISVIMQSDSISWHVVAHSLFPEMDMESRTRWYFIMWNENTDAPGAIAYDFTLEPAYPNPFNASVSIPYVIDRTGPVSLEIFDLQGRLVKTLVDAERWPGLYTARWDGRANGAETASGMYFARLRAGERIKTTRLLLLK